MWHLLARFIVKNRLPILISIVLVTFIMGYFCTKVRMQYELNAAIPTDSKEYADFQAFKKSFGEDGSNMVIGFTTDSLWTEPFFSDFKQLTTDLKKIPGVENVLSIPQAINLVKVQTDTSEKLSSVFPFNEAISKDSMQAIFYNLPFYKNLLYNPDTKSYLLSITLNKEILKTTQREELVKSIENTTSQFVKKYNVKAHYSGIPYIRTKFAESVKHEMKLILIASILLTSIILFLFFRSLSTVISCISIVLIGVVWSTACIYLFGFKVTILTALIPALVIVIGIPNCIYFLNKYHTQYLKTNNREQAIINMVDKMGIVTLFTNLTAAIGFGVFYFTKSQVLKEFGLVAGVNIMFIFFISLFALPAIFSYMKAPEEKQMRYIDNKFLSKWLVRFETWVFNKSSLVIGVWAILLVVAGIGVYTLKSDAHMLDDLPQSSALKQDLTYFEKNYKGVMPLEIVVDTKRKNGAIALSTLQKMDELISFINEQPEISKPLSIVEAIKFARQAYYDGDSTNYAMPNTFDISFLAPYLRMKADTSKNQSFAKLISSFVDSTKQKTRISANMADIGSAKMPLLINKIKVKANELFDTSRYTISYTGSSITFLKGSTFIMQSLRDSILFALAMIIVCMIILFVSGRIVAISIITNIVPLIITAGVMGWCNIPLKPSTVLVFSIALGIAIDVTIRFLVNYKQDLITHNYNIDTTIKATIKETGISIIYTSLILSAGFIVFAVSYFDGTKALGYLTALTLMLAMVTNLTLLPVLLRKFDKQSRQKSITE
jgi:predicted RND superfamily exporter protein